MHNYFQGVVRQRRRGKPAVQIKEGVLRKEAAVSGREEGSNTGHQGLNCNDGARKLVFRKNIDEGSDLDKSVTRRRIGSRRIRTDGIDEVSNVNSVCESHCRG